MNSLSNKKHNLLHLDAESNVNRSEKVVEFFYIIITEMWILFQTNYYILF